MKYIRVILVVVASLAVLGVAGWYFVRWNLNRSLQRVSREGGFRKLLDVAEASVGSAAARDDVHPQRGNAADEGALDYYQKNPQALQRDKKNFETWSSALLIADAAHKGGVETSGWRSSATLSWIPASRRADAWGRAFCVESDRQRAIVVSPGPQALSSLDCSTLKVPNDDLARMRRGMLNRHPSGVLIVFLDGFDQSR